MKISLAEAVSHVHPEAEFVIYGSSLEGLTFIKPKNLTITQEQVDNAIIEIQTEREAAALTKNEQKAELLARLGITEEEAQLLLA